MYCIDPSAEEPIMLINAQIGDAGDGTPFIDGAIFERELLQLDRLGKKRIHVWINSPGGIVTDGMSIYNAILSSKTKVDTLAVGMVASIAAVIFQAGAKRTMLEYAILMYHDPHGAAGNRAMNAFKDSIATMIKSRVGKTQDEVLSIMKRETYLNAYEAYDLGFCTDVKEVADVNVQRALTAAKPENLFVETRKVLNLLLPEKTVKTNSSMKVLNRTLGLNDDASEENIIAEVEKLRTIANKAKKEKDDSEMDSAKKLKDMEDRFNKLAEDKKTTDEAYDSVKKALEEFKKAAKEKEAADKKAKDEAEEEDCKNMVTDFAKVGRIENKAEVIADWCLTAKNIGKDKVKAMIEALPLNKTVPPAAKDIVLNKLGANDVATTTANFIAQTRAKNKK